MSGPLYESIAQLVERLPYKQDVGGSSPSILTMGCDKGIPVEYMLMYNDLC